MNKARRIIRLALAFLASCYVASLLIIVSVALSSSEVGGLFEALIKSTFLAMPGAIAVASVAILPSSVLIAILERWDVRSRWIPVAFGAGLGLAAAGLPPAAAEGAFELALYAIVGAAAGATYRILAAS